jgi:hypothetical protein
MFCNFRLDLGDQLGQKNGTIVCPANSMDFHFIVFCHEMTHDYGHPLQ